MKTIISISGKSITWLQMVYAFMIFGAIGFIAVLASVPPVSRDALIHHLAIPKLYLRHGGMYEIPYLEFSYYPMNLELLYLVPLYFKNDIIPKFIHFTFALITAAMMYRYLRRRINTEYALLGSLFFLTIPVIIRLSSTVYVDLGLICFLFASLLSLFSWVESCFKFKYLMGGAVFCGLALGTKYNGLIGLFLLGMFVAFVYSRYHGGQKFSAFKSIGWSSLFVVAALIVFSPWMLRNISWTGNPIYPLYNSVFNEKNLSAETHPNKLAEAYSRISPVSARKIIYGESWWEIALVPLRVFFQGKDDDPRYFDGKTNPFLLFLPMFALFGIRSGSQQEKTEKLMLICFSVFFLLFACAKTSVYIRYFSPILPPLVVLSMFGLYHIQTVILGTIPKISIPIKNFVVFGIIFALLGFNTIYMVNRFRLDQPLSYITGKATRDEYIQAYRPEYATFQYANKTLTRNAKILGLYIGDRGYYSDIPIEFSIEILQNFAAEAASPIDIAEKLHEKGFTHLLVNFSLFNYWVPRYSLHEKQMLKDFFEVHTFMEFKKDDYGLLRLKL